MKTTYTHLYYCIVFIACMLVPNLTNAQQLAERIGSVTTPAFGKILDRDGITVGFAYSTPEGKATLTDLDFQPIDSFNIPCADMRNGMRVLDLGAPTLLGRYVITTYCDDRFGSIESGDPTTFFREGNALIDSIPFTHHRLLLHGGRSYLLLNNGGTTSVIDLNSYEPVFSYSSFSSFDPVTLATGAVFVQKRNNDYAILDLDFALVDSFSDDIFQADTLTRFDGGRISPIDILADGKVDFFGSGVIGTGTDASIYNFVTDQEGNLLLGSSASSSSPYISDPTWNSDYFFKQDIFLSIVDVFTTANGSFNFSATNGIPIATGFSESEPVLYQFDGSSVNILNPDNGATLSTLPGDVTGASFYDLASISFSSATALYRGFASNNDFEFVLAANDEPLWAFEGKGDVEIVTSGQDSLRIIVRRERGSSLSDYEVNVYKLAPRASSVSEITLDTEFAAFPNPASDVLQLSHSSLSPGTSGNLQMIDITGRTYELGKINLGQAINTSDLPSGLYVVDFRSAAGERFVTRVLIQ